MKASVTLIFCLLFLAVAALYFYLAPEPATQVQAPVQLMKLLPLEENDEIVALKIDQPAQLSSIYLQKREDGWYIEAPVNDVADKMIVHGLVTALKLSSKARRLMPEKDWDEYGLQDAPLKVGIRTAANEKMRILLMGDRSPIGKFVYARWEGENEYFLLDLNLQKIFETRLFAFRAKKVLRYDVAKMNKFRIETRHDNFEMSLLGDDWMWSEPIAVLGESVQPEEIGAAMTDLSGLYVKEYVDGQVPGEIFEYPAATFKLWLNDQSSEFIVIGKITADMNAYFAKRADEPQVFLIDAGKVDTFLQKIKKMVDTTSQASAV